MMGLASGKLLMTQMPYQWWCLASVNHQDPPPPPLKSVLESANPAWTRSVHLDAPGQQHGQQPVSGTTTLE